MSVPWPALRPLAEGDYPCFDVAIRSTVILERNLAGFAFGSRLDGEGRVRAASLLSEAARGAGLVLQPAGSMDPELQAAVADRDLLPRSYLVDESATVGLGTETPAWASFFEREHLALRVAMPGLDLRAAWLAVSALDDAMGALVPWAFDPDAGFVMGEAVRCGTGLSAAVRFHLPALGISGLAEGAFRRAMEAGFVVSGSYAGSAPSAGALYGLSLPAAWREAEEPALDRLSRAATALVEYERRARNELLERSPWDLLDLVGRGLGLASRSRLLGRDEACDAVSGMRTGVAMGLLSGLGLAAATELWTTARARSPRRGDEPESAARARVLRTAVADVSMDERYRDV